MGFSLNSAALAYFLVSCSDGSFSAHADEIRLTAADSHRYIADEGFRQQQDRIIGDPRAVRIRLNLGTDFGKYMTDAEFRTHVDSLVDNPSEQIWSDVKTLDLSDTAVEDISPLRSLVNLEELDLKDTYVHDISPLVE